MNYMQMRSMDISNGEGVGVSLFVSGCTLHCRGCFNKEAWNPDNGQPFDKATEDKFIELASKPYISRISILGGEPTMNTNYKAVIDLLERLQILNKTIWLYSGLTYETILSVPHLKRMFRLIDVLVDGRFEYELKDPSLKFRGSSNQRIIDVKKSLESKSVVLYME